MLKTPATLRDWPLGLGLTFHCSHLLFKVTLLFLYTIYEYLHFTYSTISRYNYTLLLEREVNVPYPMPKACERLAESCLVADQRWLCAGMIVH